LTEPGVNCGNDGRMGAAFEWWRAGDNALHARNLGGDDRHMRGGDHRVAATRNVAADACDRHVAVPKLHAGQRLDFDVDERGALRLGEAANLCLGEADVFDHLFRQTGD